MSESLLNVGYKIRDSFFDRTPVTKKMDDGTRKALSKVGAYVRTSARSSIKKPRRMRLGELPDDERRIFEYRTEQAKRDGSPKPQLPFASSEPGQPPRSPTGTFKDTIFFAYDAANKSVVAGPIALNGRAGRDVPSTLEHGGETTLHDKRILIKPRPTMGPALEKNRAKLPALFEGIL